LLDRAIPQVVKQPLSDIAAFKLFVKKKKSSPHREHRAWSGPPPRARGAPYVKAHHRFSNAKEITNASAGSEIDSVSNVTRL
jgi:hypothetical protein